MAGIAWDNFCCCFPLGFPVDNFEFPIQCGCIWNLQLLKLSEFPVNWVCYSRIIFYSWFLQVIYLFTFGVYTSWFKFMIYMIYIIFISSKCISLFIFGVYTWITIHIHRYDYHDVWWQSWFLSNQLP